ncbi:YopX family protein [Tetragenococcus halophilus]|uniref:DNA-packaging protein n=1 Tax=Tetragenococcus halophilus TaxID=51669 RepID=A0AB35HM71_TETHA|nr:YopX family protein [Tetragenococcus halophilus]MCO8297246.1 DNA-packaging protein [Tetragenococcus halophilus]
MISKFRAWDKEHEEMLYPDDEDKIFFEVTVYGMNTLDMRVDPDEYGGFSYLNTVIMQSTGLYDRNGVEVYEDDIVRCSRGCPHRVIWVKEYGGSFLGGMPAWYLSGLNEGYSWTGAEEIIGNSWENPELLEDVE